MQRERITVAVKSDDVVLRDPVTKERLTTKGKTVVKNAFWLRRLKAGDCILVKSPSTAKVQKPNTTLSKGATDGDSV